MGSINNVPVVQTAAAAVHTVAKREAEAEADPALLYTTGVHTPLTYAVNHAAVAAPLTTTYHAAPVATHVATHVAAPSPMSTRLSSLLPWPRLSPPSSSMSPPLPPSLRPLITELPPPTPDSSTPAMSESVSTTWELRFPANL